MTGKKTFTRTPLASSKVRSLQETANLDPQTRVRIVAKVRTPGYVPANLRIRTKIDAHLFTADCVVRDLQGLERDPEVESVEVSSPLQLTSKDDGDRET